MHGCFGHNLENNNNHDPEKVRNNVEEKGHSQHCQQAEKRECTAVFLLVIAEYKKTN
ncbi:hypothetical protein D3C71_2223450 [compost metagenome]